MTGVVISEGSVKDYRAMEEQHYRGRMPVGIARVLVARAFEPREEIVGVLVVTRPVLNAAWRRVAWPGVQWEDKAHAAAFINQHVRRIARVVVDVKRRGLGIASALVRAYLSRPLTTHTEVVAAMARVMPLFERAGMREIPAMPSRRTRVLAQRLKEAGLEPWELMDATVLTKLLRDDRAVADAFESWARNSRHSRRVLKAGEGLVNEAMYAASQVAWPARVYVTP
ncbi:MAG: hypothetical protein NTV94_15430 [Planctomycetota bacterium]|nr:hypothetical protein [Planctomycetota bacterium]